MGVGQGNPEIHLPEGDLSKYLFHSDIQCTPDIVATFIVATLICHISWYKINVFYYIQVGYSGQSDIVARKWWSQVATISEVHQHFRNLTILLVVLCFVFFFIGLKIRLRH